MFRLQVTIIRQAFQYMDTKYAVLIVWDPIYNTITQRAIHGHDIFSAYSMGPHI